MSWTIGGVPLSAKQIEAIKKAKADGQARIKIETTKEQSAAVQKAAKKAHAELVAMAAEIRAEMAERPSFAVTMQARRRQIGMTLDELAEQTGISKSNLSRLECGKTNNPTIETLKRVGDALGLVLHVDYSAA